MCASTLPQLHHQSLQYVLLHNIQIDDVTVPPVQVNVPSVQLPAVPVSAVDDTGLPATIDTIFSVPEDAAAQVTKMSTRITKSKHLSRDRCALEATTQTGDPNTIEEALRSPNSEGWKAAMDKELLTLTSHGTMTLVEFPPKGHRPLPPKFVFKTKTNDGVFASFKARLVVGGHRQIENVDFDPNGFFAPVVSIQGARMAIYGIRVCQRIYHSTCGCSISFCTVDS